MNISRPTTGVTSSHSFQGTSTSTSPVPVPEKTPIAHHAMSPEAFAYPSSTLTQHYNASPTADPTSANRLPPLQRSTSGHEPAAIGSDSRKLSQLPAILMRRLPSSMSNDALTSMLLFVEDFLDARFVQLDLPEDSGYLAAVARFRTLDGAHEARNKLHGKSTLTNESTMIVEILHSSNSNGIINSTSREASEAQPTRQLSLSKSSAASPQGRQSRFNSSFKVMDKRSPPNLRREISGGGEFPMPESDSQVQSLFPPRSPVAKSVGERLRISGKAVINDEVADEETGELLKDPVAYARSGQSGSLQRRSSNAQPPVSRLANLRLDIADIATTDGAQMLPPSVAAYGHPRSSQPMHSPTAEMSPTAMTNGIPPMSPTGTFQVNPQHFHRNHYPPANPADQNPPCNTLYVGNLPIDTSEDELKAMFSKQRGYKRLCFRTKHNGPMCFVEFEDVSFATKALNELYGHPLHNSVKGGIRLSFSKNPLGVRTGQVNGMGLISPLASPNAGSGFGSPFGCPPGFATASGPPPGLAVPPGLSPPMTAGLGSSGSAHSMTGFFSPSSPPVPATSPPSSVRGQLFNHAYFSSGMSHNINPVGSGFTGYMAGR